MRILTAMVAAFTVLILGCGDDDSEGDSTETCFVDTACKGERICVDGACQNPPDTSGMDGGISGAGGAGGPSLAECGNDSCETGESCASCPNDCGTCAELSCGDGTCSESECETCANCPDDCGQCSQVGCSCGDGVCDAYYCGEDGASCGQDCVASDTDGGDDGADVTGPATGKYRCGNGVCEPGETELCDDCLSEPTTCDQPCSNNCDCKQPWTACGVGAEQKCTPLACADCYRRGQYCCWCPADICANVSCVAPGTTCPAC